MAHGSPVSHPSARCSDVSTRSSRAPTPSCCRPKSAAGQLPGRGGRHEQHDEEGGAPIRSNANHHPSPAHRPGGRPGADANRRGGGQSDAEKHRSSPRHLLDPAKARPGLRLRASGRNPDRGDRDEGGLATVAALSLIWGITASWRETPTSSERHGRRRPAPRLSRMGIRQGGASASSSSRRSARHPGADQNAARGVWGARRARSTCRVGNRETRHGSTYQPAHYASPLPNASARRHGTLQRRSCARGSARRRRAIERRRRA